jgi:hypothetical protein
MEKGAENQLVLSEMRDKSIRAAQERIECNLSDTITRRQHQLEGEISSKFSEYGVPRLAD